MSNFTIIKQSQKFVKRFHLRGRTLEFKIDPVPQNENSIAWVRKAVGDIVQYVTADVEPTDQIGFTFACNNFNKGQGWLRFTQASDVSVDDVWAVLNGIFQSNASGSITDTFCLGVTIVQTPVGSGQRANKYNTFTEESAKRKGIVTIENKDNLCLPRALVVAMAKQTNDPEYIKIRRNIGKIQTRRANELLAASGIIIPAEGAGLPQLQQFQRHLEARYKICVYQYGSKGRDVIYEGTGTADNKITLNLLFHKGHYNVITSLTAAFCCSYYCERCHASYDHKNEHRCGGSCFACQKSPACVSNGVKIRCSECSRWFKNQTCFDNHKQSTTRTSSVCSKIVCCNSCLKTIKNDRVHKCGEVYCKVCQKHALSDHLCYMRPDLGKPQTDKLLFVFYDLETRQEKIIDEHTVEHEPNLCVMQKRCSTCIHEDDEGGDEASSVCSSCGVKTLVLQDRVIPNFVDRLLDSRKKFKTVIVLAHNGQAFDHQFVLNYILTRTDLTPDLIMRGTKIISMRLGNITFLDSLNYFPMALSKLPKAFGLPDTFKKGYFPHLFNTLENASYVGPLPDINYYSPDTMKDDERTKFLAWYETNKFTYTFNMQKDLVEYCTSDVDILRKACLKFREQLLEAGNVCPFSEATTIASACNKVYRRNFLKPETIGIIPRGGYRKRDVQSRIASTWLLWEEKTRGINICHSLKQKETRLGGQKVDGYCAETNQIFEFQGCYWHGHPECLKHNRDKPLSEDPTQTLNLRYESTVLKTQRLKSLGFEIVEKWECHFRGEMRANPEIELYVSTCPLLQNSPLNPRDAFYGGRTGNTKTYYKAQPGEKIHYIDICSLYPFICKTGKFPIGHPKIHVGSECPQSISADLNGIIKCTILPPQNLYHPVLPAKINNKLMFSLCNTCSVNQSSGECEHDVDERKMTGTWVVDEVRKAIEKGYTLLEVHEIWEFAVQQYNPFTKTGGLFTEMMNKFLKIKQQASGWPSNCSTEEAKNQYIEDFFNQEGIRLEYADIVENPGLRALAKLILNSFWGKLGQKDNQAKTKIVNKPDEFFTMMSDPALVINSVLPVNDDTVVVNFQHVEESYDILSTVNVSLAAFTTAQARLTLYTYLEKLQERVLYYDTDSVIYISRPSEFDPPLGSCIGDMTNELDSFAPDCHIVEFISGGPKNYAFLAHSPINNTYYEVCKVKGICITHETSKEVNFSRLKSMITGTTDEDKEPRKIAFNSIRRTATHNVITTHEEKVFRANSTKRKFENFDSLPYGFKKPKQTQALDLI